MFEIKNATKVDIPLIRELTFRVWPQTYASLLPKDQIEYMLKLMYSEESLENQMKEGSRFVIIYDDGNPVGFAAFEEIKPSIWKLHKLYILPNQQGKGTGRFMLDHIIDSIKQQNAKALQLQVKRDNKAKDFYEKQGFTIIETADFDIGNGYFMKDYVMEKKLS